VSTLTTSEPLSLWRVDFPDLYARHLCRHSQFGINVVHLAALFGVWFGVYGLVLSLTRLEWLPIALAVAYFGLVALSAPVRVCLATAAFLTVFVAALWWLPELPAWAYLAMIPACYEVQSLSHKVWTAAADMTEYNKRFPKGATLFVVLLIQEVPLCLNYLLFDSRRWKA
jgi:hypothetical protein